MKSQFPFGGRHQRTGSHLEACRECAAAVRRERQYLERLRDAPIPPASDDLTARLLTRTHELAAQPPTPAHHGGTSRMAARALAFTAGGTMAAAGVLAVGAFTAAGDPVAEGAGTAAAFSHASSQTPADGRTLTPAQLATLRSEGWACPELQAMGFRLQTARALVVDGQPAVELRFTDGAHHATVTEQHPLAAEAGKQATAAPGQAEGEGGPLRVWGTSPGAATYRTAGLSITYRSDLPAEQADDALPILQQLADTATEGVVAAVPEARAGQSTEPLESRLERGISKIAALFTR